MSGAPPLRFLAAVAGGWVCLRAAMLAPDWVREVEEPAPDAAAAPRPAEAHAAVKPGSEVAVRCELCGHQPGLGRALTASLAAPSLLRPSLTSAPIHLTRAERIELPRGAALMPSAPLAAPSAAQPVQPPLARPLLPARRWSASAWAFVRRGGGAQLAAGGTLGGSQIGGRLAYGIDGEGSGPLSVVARAYAPASRPGAGEVALGLEWQPLREVPFRLLGERRQAIGREGRSAFALIAHGGLSRPIGTAVLDAYVQAGIVGARSRDLFADGSVAVALPLEESGRLKAGAAVWGAAQPGVSRVDAGPQLTLSLPVEGRNLRLSLDWRIRVAGDASPASGPALTLATEF